MNTALRFFLDTLSRIGSSIFAGSLVSCLIVGRIEPLHIGLMLAGIVLTGLGYPGNGRLS
jgi:ABC-type transporter Mla maintaining outer membrane lipid asymmetry permease subunit MlaE